MGGDDSQKLLPWRGSTPLRGANLRLHYEINNVTQVGISRVPTSLASLAIASATARLGHFWQAQVVCGVLEYAESRRLGFGSREQAQDLGEGAG